MDMAMRCHTHVVRCVFIKRKKPHTFPYSVDWSLNLFCSHQDIHILNKELLYFWRLRLTQVRTVWTLYLLETCLAAYFVPSPVSSLLFYPDPFYFSSKTYYTSTDFSYTESLIYVHNRMFSCRLLFCTGELLHFKNPHNQKRFVVLYNV